MMPLDLVAEVSLRLRWRDSSKANFITRSQPKRVSTVSWMTISWSVPGNMRPPISEYSPSLFSRTM
jgi:hypothetical protein